MHLDVNAPALHESYVASWEHADSKRDLQRSWRLELPLSVANMQVGRLDVSGRRNGRSVLEEITQLLDLLEPFEIRLASIANREDARKEAFVLTK